MILLSVRNLMGHSMKNTASGVTPTGNLFIRVLRNWRIFLLNICQTRAGLRNRHEPFLKLNYLNLIIGISRVSDYIQWSLQVVWKGDFLFGRLFVVWYLKPDALEKKSKQQLRRLPANPEQKKCLKRQNREVNNNAGQTRDGSLSWCTEKIMIKYHLQLKKENNQ